VAEPAVPIKLKGMSSFLFCTSYINSQLPNLHPLRYRKWVDYYSAIVAELDVDYVFVIDDGTPILDFVERREADILYLDQPLPDSLEKRINILSFPDHLGRSTLKDYPGWWRSFTFSIKVADKYGFDKIIHIESDFYIPSKRLRHYLAELRSGWTTLYSSFYKFPETAVQVICADSFSKFREIARQAESRQYKFDQFAENMLPFTAVVKNFNGDRVMEPAVLRDWATRRLDPGELDYIGQLPTNVKPLSHAEFSGFMHQLKTEMMYNRNMTFENVMDIFRARNAVIDFERV
jgi:hypothetical protein